MSKQAEKIRTPMYNDRPISKWVGNGAYGLAKGSSKWFPITDTSAIVAYANDPKIQVAYVVSDQIEWVEPMFAAGEPIEFAGAGIYYLGEISPGDPTMGGCWYIAEDQDYEHDTLQMLMMNDVPIMVLFLDRMRDGDFYNYTIYNYCENEDQL